MTWFIPEKYTYRKENVRDKPQYFILVFHLMETTPNTIIILESTETSIAPVVSISIKQEDRK